MHASRVYYSRVYLVKAIQLVAVAASFVDPSVPVVVLLTIIMATYMSDVCWSSH